MSYLPSSIFHLLQERAWYDSHRASLIPEPDAADVLEEIRKGAPPPRARDRGLTVRHLTQFFDISVFDGFDDGPNVSAAKDVIESII